MSGNIDPLEAAKTEQVQPTEEDMEISEEAADFLMGPDMAGKVNFLIDLCGTAALMQDPDFLGTSISALMIFAFNAGRNYKGE